jgi:hypothetical protein
MEAADESATGSVILFNRQGMPSVAVSTMELLIVDGERRF